jgi:hypothetical protein
MRRQHDTHLRRELEDLSKRVREMKREMSWHKAFGVLLACCVLYAVSNSSGQAWDGRQGSAISSRGASIGLKYDYSKIGAVGSGDLTAACNSCSAWERPRSAWAGSTMSPREENTKPGVAEVGGQLLSACEHARSKQDSEPGKHATLAEPQQQLVPESAHSITAITSLPTCAFAPTQVTSTAAVAGTELTDTLRTPDCLKGSLEEPTDAPGPVRAERCAAGVHTASTAPAGSQDVHNSDPEVTAPRRGVKEAGLSTSAAASVLLGILRCSGEHIHAALPGGVNRVAGMTAHAVSTVEPLYQAEHSTGHRVAPPGRGGDEDTAALAATGAVLRLQSDLPDAGERPEEIQARTPSSPAPWAARRTAGVRAPASRHAFPDPRAVQHIPGVCSREADDSRRSVVKDHGADITKAMFTELTQSSPKAEVGSPFDKGHTVVPPAARDAPRANVSYEVRCAPCAGPCGLPPLLPTAAVAAAGGAHSAARVGLALRDCWGQELLRSDHGDFGTSRHMDGRVPAADLQASWSVSAPPHRGAAALELKTEQGVDSAYDGQVLEREVNEAQGGEQVILVSQLPAVRKTGARHTDGRGTAMEDWAGSSCACERCCSDGAGAKSG